MVERVHQVEPHAWIVTHVLNLSSLDVLEAELKVEAVVESDVVEEFSYVFGGHAFDDRVYHGEESVVFESSELWVMEFEVFWYFEEYEEERFDFW